MKKPFYKRWWFIVIVVMFAIGIIGNISTGWESLEDKPVKKEVAKVEEKPKETPKETPEKKLEQALSKITFADFDKMNGQFAVEPYSLALEFTGKENLSQKMTVTGMRTAIRDVLYVVKESGLDMSNVKVAIKYPLVDKYGNTSDEYVIKSDFSGDTIDKLNENKNAINTDNIPEIADSWWEHPALSK